MKKDEETIKKEVTKKVKETEKPKDNLAFQLDERVFGFVKKVNPLQLLEKDEKKGEDRKEEEEDAFEYNLEERTGVLDRWSETKQILSSVIFAADYAFDLIEKLEKLLKWEDQEASTVVLVVILLAFFVVTFIPLRTIICLALVAKFNKGSTWYRRRWVGNRECCKIEMRNFFLDKELYPFDVLFGKDEREWLGKKWPRGQDHTALKEHFQKVFKIILPDNFHKTYPTPWLLMKEVAYVDEPLFLAPGDSRNQWDIRNNKKLYWPSKNPIYFVVQFIHNNIASNIFLYQNYGMHKFTSD